MTQLNENTSRQEQGVEPKEMERSPLKNEKEPAGGIGQEESQSGSEKERMAREPFQVIKMTLGLLRETDGALPDKGEQLEQDLQRSLEYIDSELAKKSSQKVEEIIAGAVREWIRQDDDDHQEDAPGNSSKRLKVSLPSVDKETERASKASETQPTTSTCGHPIPVENVCEPETSSKILTVTFDDAVEEASMESKRGAETQETKTHQNEALKCATSGNLNTHVDSEGATTSLGTATPSASEEQSIVPHEKVFIRKHPTKRRGKKPHRKYVTLNFSLMMKMKNKTKEIQTEASKEQSEKTTNARIPISTSSAQVPARTPSEKRSKTERRLAIERKVYYSRNDPDNLRAFLLQTEPTVTIEELHERKKAQFQKDLALIRSFYKPQHQEKSGTCKEKEEMLRISQTSQRNKPSAMFEKKHAGNEAKKDDSSVAPPAAAPPAAASPVADSSAAAPPIAAPPPAASPAAAPSAAPPTAAPPTAAPPVADSSAVTPPSATPPTAAPQTAASQFAAPPASAPPVADSSAAPPAAAPPIAVPPTAAAAPTAASPNAAPPTPAPQLAAPPPPALPVADSSAAPSTPAPPVADSSAALPAAAPPAAAPPTAAPPTAAPSAAAPSAAAPPAASPVADSSAALPVADSSAAPPAAAPPIAAPPTAAAAPTAASPTAAPPTAASSAAPPTAAPSAAAPPAAPPVADSSAAPPAAALPAAAPPTAAPSAAPPTAAPSAAPPAASPVADSSAALPVADSSAAPPAVAPPIAAPPTAASPTAASSAAPPTAAPAAAPSAAPSGSPTFLPEEEPTVSNQMTPPMTWSSPWRWQKIFCEEPPMASRPASRNNDIEEGLLFGSDYACSEGHQESIDEDLESHERTRPVERDESPESNIYDPNLEVDFDAPSTPVPDIRTIYLRSPSCLSDLYMNMDNTVASQYGPLEPAPHDESSPTPEPEHTSPVPSSSRRKPAVVKRSKSCERSDFPDSVSNIICPAALDEQHTSHRSTPITARSSTAVSVDNFGLEEEAEDDPEEGGLEPAEVQPAKNKGGRPKKRRKANNWNNYTKKWKRQAKRDKTDEDLLLGEPLPEDAAFAERQYTEEELLGAPEMPPKPIQKKRGRPRKIKPKEPEIEEAPEEPANGEAVAEEPQEPEVGEEEDVMENPTPAKKPRMLASLKIEAVNVLPTAGVRKKPTFLSKNNPIPKTRFAAKRDVDTSDAVETDEAPAPEIKKRAEPTTENEEEEGEELLERMLGPPVDDIPQEPEEAANVEDELSKKRARLEEATMTGIKTELMDPDSKQEDCQVTAVNVTSIKQEKGEDDVETTAVLINQPEQENEHMAPPLKDLSLLDAVSYHRRILIEPIWRAINECFNSDLKKFGELLIVLSNDKERRGRVFSNFNATVEDQLNDISDELISFLARSSSVYTEEHLQAMSVSFVAVAEERCGVMLNDHRLTPLKLHGMIALLKAYAKTEPISSIPAGDTALRILTIQYIEAILKILGGSTLVHSSRNKVHRRIELLYDGFRMFLRRGGLVRLVLALDRPKTKPLSEIEKMQCIGLLKHMNTNYEYLNDFVSLDAEQTFRRLWPEEVSLETVQRLDADARPTGNKNKCETCRRLNEEQDQNVFFSTNDLIHEHYAFHKSKTTQCEKCYDNFPNDHTLVIHDLVNHGNSMI